MYPSIRLSRRCVLQEIAIEQPPPHILKPHNIYVYYLRALFPHRLYAVVLSTLLALSASVTLVRPALGTRPNRLRLFFWSFERNLKTFRRAWICMNKLVLEDVKKIPTTKNFVHDKYLYVYVCITFFSLSLPLSPIYLPPNPRRSLFSHCLS